MTKLNTLQVMKDEFGSFEDLDRSEKEKIFSKVVKAGKRTYFFDVKATRNDEYYLTVTESKKRTEKDGKVFYEKHKIFLYKEDFDKFLEGATEVIDFVKSKQEVVARPEYIPDEDRHESTKEVSINFEDLDA